MSAAAIAAALERPWARTGFQPDRAHFYGIFNVFQAEIAHHLMVVIL